jgi:hypothetical protein
MMSDQVQQNNMYCYEQYTYTYTYTYGQNVDTEILTVPTGVLERSDSVLSSASTVDM